jgi:anti-sigma regulatory factor (Ser/Thr protein kinase)
MNAAPKEFPARMSALSEVLSHVAAICRTAGLTGAQGTSVELVIEELFSNTVDHGYPQDSERPVWIAAHSDSNALHLVYQDLAARFNPLERPKERSPSRPGGWGVQLVENFADAVYRYENGRNTLTLTFKINQPVESPDTRAG